MSHLVSEVKEDASAGVFRRILTYSDLSVPWQRRLWSLGTVTALEDLLLSAHALDQGILSEESFNYANKSFINQIKSDDVLKGNFEKIFFKAYSEKETLHFNSSKFHQLESIRKEIADNYLDRAVDFVKSLDEKNPNLLSVEQFSRNLCSHVLNNVCSHKTLYSIATRVTNESKMLKGYEPLLLLLEELLQKKSKRRFSCIFVFSSIGDPNIKKHAGYLSREEIQDIIRDKNFVGDLQLSISNIAGGLLIEKESSDFSGLEDAISEDFERLKSRISISGKETSVSSSVIVVSNDKVSSINIAGREKNRKIKINAISSQKSVLHEFENVGRFDYLVELIDSLRGAPTGAAVVCGWAAVESALSIAGEKGKGVLCEVAPFPWTVW